MTVPSGPDDAPDPDESRSDDPPTTPYAQEGTEPQGYPGGAPYPGYHQQQSHGGQPGYGSSSAYGYQPGYQQPDYGYQPGYPPGYPQYGYPTAPYGIHPPTGIPYSEKSKIVAGLLQVLLPLGIGRMYMGHTGMGVAQLLVTIFTCGIGAVWPFIDGIIILVNDTTDADGRMLRS
jgi:TM2 domain-containing membrane protein YozV